MSSRSMILQASIAKSSDGQYLAEVVAESTKVFSQIPNRIRTPTEQ